MNTRSIIFENFRNMGLGCDKNINLENLGNKLQLGSIDESHIGGLIILVGGNNDGKSNVLEASSSLGEKKLHEDDVPNL